MDPLPFWAQDADKATAAEGKAIAERIVEAWVERLRRDEADVADAGRERSKQEEDRWK